MKKYEPQGFANDIFSKRYTIHETETWLEACSRVATHVASADTGDKNRKVKDDFYDVLSTNQFMPGGRIWYGSGRAKGQLLNCFVLPTNDSREAWGQTVSDMIVVSGTGGGVGINASSVRPRGQNISGTGGQATGAVSLMEIINAAGEVIKAGGGRRTALMLALNISHGDIQEFLDKKLDLKQLNNANVSVMFDGDPEVFFDAVKTDSMWNLTFGNKAVGQVPAKKLWEKIVKNALANGEPGLLNSYYANKMSNIYYHAPLICTNPCGEIYLSAYDCCCLGALVLPRFVSEGGNINWEQLASATETGVRFLDNVLSVNTYPLPRIAQTCSDIRRIGLGVMGLHDILLMQGQKYNSAQGLELVDRLMKFIKNRAYEASIKLAEEKGAFPKFDADKFLKSNFIKTLKPTIRNAIKEKGIRNCAILTIAPTGTTSMVSAVTSGIEPMFAPAYERRWWKGDTREMEVVVHPLFKEFIEKGKDISHFQSSYELGIRDHFEMQRVCQRHIDNAVSKTINIPQGVSFETMSELYMEYFPELKGVTIYPEGSRENQPLTPLSNEEAFKHALDGIVDSTTKDSCRSGVCDI